MAKAIAINVEAVGDSKIGDLIKPSEVFSGDDKKDYLVVVRDGAFDDAISKLKTHFGQGNVQPYADKIARKAKKEKYFFV